MDKISGSKTGTINRMWLISCKNFGDRAALCSRKSSPIMEGDKIVDEQVNYKVESYDEINGQILEFGKGLIEIGLMEGQAVGIVAENSKRWMVSDLAILANRAYDVPRGTSSTDDELLYILAHAEVGILILENGEELERFKKLHERLPGVKKIIVLDSGFKESSPEHSLFSFDDIIRLGRGSSKETERLFWQRREETVGSDLATLMYTSGTSGTPKGIPLSHSNLMHNIETIPFMLKVLSNDSFLSILPIWHIFERTLEYMVFRVGASIWYTTRLSILADITLVKPTFMASVPRIWIMIYNGVMKKLKHSGKEGLFKKLFSHTFKVIKARRYKQQREHLYLDEESERPRATLVDHIMHRLADLLIYRKIRAKVGAKFRAGVSGGGSLPEYVDDFFEGVGITLLEGYGLTETSPVLCVRTFDHNIPYSVGCPLPQTETTIEDEDGNPVKDSESGTLWVSGPQVMDGYYKNPEESAKVLKRDSNGKLWFNTGDIARRTKSGDISILGRVKDTIVLIGGENIEPAAIEGALVKQSYIDQVMVCGQDQEYLTALIVPDEDRLQELCRQKSIHFDKSEIKGLLDNEVIKKFFLDLVKRTISKECGFKEIEFIHNIAFIKPITVEDNTLTNTFKIKRHKVMERDYEVVRSLYPHYNEQGSKKR